MQTDLLEEESQNYINRENDRLGNFTSELQFFVSNHNIINSFISFFVYILFICYQFLSSLSPAPIDNPTMLPIDYPYAILTGTISSPTKPMILILTFFFDTVVIANFLLTFFIAFYVLITPLHHPFVTKAFGFFWFYFIPLLTPILLVVFSRGYIYLSINDDHLLFFLTLLSNVLLYAIILFTGICNSVSSYKLTHFLSAQKPFQVIILIFSIAFVHQLISFVNYPSVSLLFVSVIIQFVGIIYFSIFPLYADQWLTFISLAYYIFAFGLSIARTISTQMEIWIPSSILGVSFAVAFCISFISKRIFYTKIGYINNVFERKSFDKKDIINSILTLDLNSLETYKLWAIAKFDYNIPIEILTLIYKKLLSRNSKDLFDAFFLFALKQRLKSNQEEDISVFLSSINSLKAEFWKAVWKSDPSLFSSLSAKIGHDRLVLKQSLLFHFKSNPEMKEKIKENFDPTYTKQSKTCFSTFHLVCLILFILSISSQIILIIIYRKSYSKFVRFTNIRDFLSIITLLQIDLWPTDHVSVGKTFIDAKNQWEKIQDDELFTTKSLGGMQYYQIINQYLNAIENYNLTKILTSEVTDIQIFEIFGSLFHKENKNFEQSFGEQTSKISLFLFATIIIFIVLYISIFLISMIVSSSREHRFFKIFQSFHKQDIKTYCQNQFGYKINEKTEKLVPLPLQKIEWKALKYYVASFVVSFLLAVIHWIINVINYYLLLSNSIYLSDYMDKSGYMIIAFAYYSAGIFYENVSTVQTSQIILATRESDAQFNNLFNIDSKRSLIRLIPESILKNLASYLYLSTITESTETIKDTILKLSSGFDLNDPPLYQNDFEFYLRTFIMMMLTIFITVLCYIWHYFLNDLHLSSMNEKHSLLFEFEQSFNIDKSWRLSQYKSEELPLIILIASADMKIKFASNMAKEKLAVDVGNKITDINLDLIHSSEIINAIHDMKNSNASEPVRIRNDNENFTIISPSFQIISCIKTLRSIVLIDDIEEPVDSDDTTILESANPFFKVGSPTSVSFKNDQTALISLKLIGLSAFVNNNIRNPQVIKSYLTTILSKIDEFEDFARISVRNNTLLLVSHNITFSSVNQFVSICADFGMKAQEIVATISKQYEAPVYCSVLFHRCEAMTLKMSEASCGQSDFTSNVVNFIDECHSHFLMNAIGFVPRMKITQILNMSKIMTIPLKNGSTADIFIFI